MFYLLEAKVSNRHVACPNKILLRTNNRDIKTPEVSTNRNYPTSRWKE
jgi:hypothetical protein